MTAMSPSYEWHDSYCTPGERELAMLLCLPAILIIGELQSCPRRINSHWGALSKRSIPPSQS